MSDVVANGGMNFVAILVYNFVELFWTKLIFLVQSFEALFRETVLAMFVPLSFYSGSSSSVVSVEGTVLE
jgi:hypothetical protein